MSWTKKAKRNLRLKKDFFRANNFLSQHPHYFDQIKAYSFFIGYPRSSHSLIGSLLDAHPEAAIAHEQDALFYINNGFNREQLYALLLKNAMKTGQKGRIQTGYSYQVPGQYQGTWKELKLIGDKKGSNTSRWLRDMPELLDRLRHTINEKLRVIHISRNPFDNIATMAYHEAKGNVERITDTIFQKEKNNYLEQARVVEETRKKLNKEAFFHLRINDFLSEPDQYLTELQNFLGLTIDNDYIESCKSILYQKPNQSRWLIPWPESVIEEIEETIKDLPCLAGYSFKE